MPKKAAKKELYSICGNSIKVLEEDLIKLANDAEQSAKVAALKKLGYELILVKPEPKVRKTFTKEKAEIYIKEYDKKGLKAFQGIAEDSKKAAAAYSALVAAKKRAEAEDATEADKKAMPAPEDIQAARKLMIVSGKDAFNEQKKYFKKKYGEEAYQAVKEMK